MINFFTNLKQKFLPKYNDLDKDHYFIESNNQKIFFDVNDIANRNLIRWSLKQSYNKSNAHKNIFYYEKKQFSIMQSILGKSEVFWDIGCQTGIYSLSAYFFQNIKKIISVDIMPVFINTLKKNIHLNKFDFKKFIILNVAVGSKLVSQTEYLASNSVMGVNFDYISKKSQSIPRQNDLIKIDIEGWEHSYKETFFDFVKLNKPTLILGLHRDFLIKLTNNKISQNLICKDLMAIYKYTYFMDQKDNVSDISQNENFASSFNDITPTVIFSENKLTI